MSSRPRPGAKTAVTLYETLAVRNGLSLVRCQLITGRTHQIRAQFAAAGHPLLGDGKYGSERQNKRYGRSYQACTPTGWSSASLPGRRGAGSSGRTAVPGGTGGLRDGIFSRLFPLIPAGSAGISPHSGAPPVFLAPAGLSRFSGRGDFTEIFDKIH